MPPLRSLNRREILNKFSMLTLIAPGLVSACSDPRADFRSKWKIFRGRNFMTDGRIIDTGNEGISHSEGQGLGLLFAQAADDVKAFLTIYEWTKHTLQTRTDSLFVWKYDPRLSMPVADQNNASDGDIYIAWALLRAARRWKMKALREDALKILTSLKQHCLYQNKTYPQILLPGADGFHHGASTTTNLSYYVFPALGEFAIETGDPIWFNIQRTGLALAQKAKFGDLSLPPNWLQVDQEGEVTIAENFPPHFGWDAIRLPLFLYWSGEEITYEKLQNMKAVPQWIDLRTNETAPMSMSKGAEDVLALIRGKSLSPALDKNEDYYSHALSMLCQLALEERGGDIT